MVTPNPERHRHAAPIPAPAASRRTSNGNLVNAAGLYLLGYKLDAAGNVPTDASALSLVNTSSISGAAQATSKLTIQANLQSGSTVDAAYTAGDMTSRHRGAGLHPHRQCL